MSFWSKSKIMIFCVFHIQYQKSGPDECKGPLCRFWADQIKQFFRFQASWNFFKISFTMIRKITLTRVHCEISYVLEKWKIGGKLQDSFTFFPFCWKKNELSLNFCSTLKYDVIFNLLKVIMFYNRHPEKRCQ